VKTKGQNRMATAGWCFMSQALQAY